MTARKKNPMSPRESGRLGGLVTAQDREHMSRIGYLGAMANIEKNGIDQVYRAQAASRGRRIRSIAPSRAAKAGRLNPTAPGE